MKELGIKNKIQPTYEWNKPIFKLKNEKWKMKSWIVTGDIRILTKVKVAHKIC